MRSSASPSAKFAGQFIQKKLRLIYEPTDRQVLTDEKWLSFVLDQLLSNALKYTSTGSITISVDENLVLSISDTGIGIAPEDLPRIFERSYTGYNGRAEKSSTGLGLYLCRKISCACRIPSPFPLKSEKEAPSPSTCPGSSWMWNNARPGTARQIFFQPFTFARFGCHLSDREMAADLMPCYTDSRTAAGRNAPGLSLPKTGKARSGDGGLPPDNLGFVFQDFNLLDTFDLKDNILLPLVLSGAPYQEMMTRLRPIAAKLGIAELLYKYPYEVSGGQKQRAAVARALITRPQLILADEPTGALDSRSTDELLSLFNEINREGQTILMVTHSTKAASHAGRVLFIKDGKVFHQLYRGERTSEKCIRISPTPWTILQTGGENR